MSFAAPLALIAGTAMNVIGALGEGQQQKGQYEYQAQLALRDQQVAEMQARAAEEKAAYDQQQFQRRAARMQGATRAKLGASGALMSTGAPLAVLGAQAAELALDSSMIGYNGMVAARGYRDQGAMDYAQSKIYEQQGRNAERSSYWKAGSSLLQGFGSAYSSGMFGLGVPKSPGASFPGSGSVQSGIGQSTYRMH